MNLASLLDDRVVTTHLEGMTSEEAIAELVELLVRAGKIKDRQALLDAVYDREAKGSTGIGGSIAVPHARSSDVSGLALAIGISRQGLDFNAVDDKPVHVVILLVAAPDKPGPNVEVLADIGRLAQIPNVCQTLMQAHSPGELVRAIEKAQHPR